MDYILKIWTIYGWVSTKLCVTEEKYNEMNCIYETKYKRRKEKNEKKENDGINNRNLNPPKVVCKYIKFIK